jgi:hypothetical protein
MVGRLRLTQKSPRHNGGRAQVGLLFPDSYYDVFSVDMMKQSLGFFPQGASNNNWPFLLNADGFPNALPTGGTWGVSQCYIYGTAGTVWVLDWTLASGAATIAMTAGFTGGGLTENIISSTRREYTITGTPQNTTDGLNTPGGVAKVNIPITALSGRLTSLRLYRKTDESRLAMGGAEALFTSEFLGRTDPFGSQRFMDWMRCNEGRPYRWEHRRPDTHFSWAAQIVNGDYFYGTMTNTAPLNTFTVNTLPTLTNGLPMQAIMNARPNKLDISAVTKGNPTIFTSVNHGLAGGEKLFGDQGADGGGSWTTTFQTKSTSTGLTPDFTVTRIDDDNFSLPINSTAFANPSTMALMPSIYITDGTVTKRVYRKGLFNHFYSEFGSGKTYPFLYTAIYDAKFDCFIMSGDGSGDIYHLPMPLYVPIALANHSRSHPWFNFSFYADDDYWTNAVTVIKNGLIRGLKARYGPGNEIWNTATDFHQTRYAQSCAAVDGLNTGFGVTAWNLAYAKRFNEVCDLIEAVYGAGDDWLMMLECQLGDVSANRLQGNAAINGGNPARYPANRADGICTAPYTSPIFGGSGGNSVNYPGLLDKVDDYNQGGASRDAAYAWMTDEMITASTLGWKAGAATLDDEIALVATRQVTLNSAGYTGRRGTGLPQFHYEGGPCQFKAANFTSAGWNGVTGIAAPTSGRIVKYTDLQAFWLGWLASSQAADYMRAHFQGFADAGVLFPAQYCITGNWNINTNQGLYKLNDVAAGPIPAFTELVNWNNGN